MNKGHLGSRNNPFRYQSVSAGESCPICSWVHDNLVQEQDLEALQKFGGAPALMAGKDEEVIWCVKCWRYFEK